MYELNRVLLRNFGPRDARYEHVDLDLSEVGEPVSDGALVSDASHAALRPSPASLVMLQNGGGKGVLLTAIMCTTIPYHFKDLDALRNFVVSTAQPSHIVMEWADARTGRLLVTGQVLAPAADKSLSRLFYSFHPGGALNAARLPFHNGVSWLSIDEFCTELRDLKARNNTLGLHEESGQREWEAHQKSLGLDPDLFNVQRLMNATESGAANAFTTTTSDAFIEWLLRKAADESTYEAIGKMFKGYAGAISQYQQWRQERSFAVEMQGHCQEIHEAHIAQQECATHAGNVAKTLAGLASTLLARSRNLLDEQQQCNSAFDTADALHRARMRARDSAADILRHVEWHAWQLDLAALQEARSKTEAARLKTVGKRDAWTQVPLALDLAAARTAFESVQLALATAEGDIAPFANAADTAAARLRIGLQLAETAVLARISALEEQARNSAKQVESWRSRMGALDREDGAAQSEAQHLAGLIAAFETDLQQSRDLLVVLAGENAADAAFRARVTEEELKEKTADAKAAIQAARTAANTARHGLPTTDRAAAQAAAAAERADTAIERLRALAQLISQDPLSSELLETPVDESDGDTLVRTAASTEPLRALARHRRTALGGAIVSNRRSLERDQEYLTVLDTSAGLLPARSQVRSICTSLRDNGITAHPGWAWMRDNLPADLHARAVSDHPDLVDGVIVTDEPALEQARLLLDKLRPLPTAAVAIATGDRFANTVPADQSGRTVVEPTPAMHDEQAAARERQTVEDRIRETTEALQQQEADLKAAEALLSVLDRWLDELGPAPIEERLHELTGLQALAAEAERAAETAHEQAQELERRVSAAEAEHESVQIQWTAQQRTAEQLEGLAQRESAAKSAGARITEIEILTAARRSELQELKAACTAANEEGLRRAALIQKDKLEASSYTIERKGITATADNERSQSQTGVTETLATLRQQYKQTAAELEARKIGEDLLARAEAAGNNLRAYQAAWNDVSQPVQTQALDLARDARADDPVQRDALIRALDEEAIRLQAEVSSLDARRAGINVRLEQARPVDEAAWLDDESARDWTPHDLTEAQGLLAAARNLKSGAETAAVTASTALADARRAKQQADHDRTTIAPVLALFESAVKGMTLDQEARPYLGSLDGADVRVREAVDNHSQAHKRNIAADRAVERAVAALKDAASNVAYERLDIPLRIQISGLDGRKIPALAAEWTTALTDRVAVLTRELSGIEGVRDTLVLQLAGRVSEELKKLDRASAFSVFPDDAGPWSGQRFLTIKYQAPEPAHLHTYIRETVEGMAATPKGSDTKGIDVVMRCVQRSVPRGFTAKILKPTASHTIEHVPVERMKSVFSGGQELTGAILLYCALAALRTSPSPRSRTRHGGLLILDNPIGRANADYLMQIQQDMAAALGIQLLYTTGLSDDNATLRFPLRIQLRNDAEARSGLSLIRVEKHLQRVLAPEPRITPDPEAPQPHGYLSAARIYTKAEGGQ